jgi:hypothetical protein
MRAASTRPDKRSPSACAKHVEKNQDQISNTKITETEFRSGAVVRTRRAPRRERDRYHVAESRGKEEGRKEGGVTHVTWARGKEL